MEKKIIIEQEKAEGKNRNVGGDSLKKDNEAGAEKTGEVMTEEESENVKKVHQAETERD